MPSGYYDAEFNKRIADEANARRTPSQQLTGLQPLNYNPATGGVPAVTSPGYSAAQSTAANLANLPALSDLASQVNAYNRTNFYSGIPNYGAMSSQSSANIGSALRGELPDDVTRNLARQAAERGVAIGSPGAPNVGANYLRNLGLTSLDQQRYGETAFTNAVNRGTRAPYFSPVAGFVTPEAQQEAQTTANIYESAPIPAFAQQAQANAVQRGLQTGYQGARSFTPFNAGSQNTSAGVVNSILARYANQTQPQQDPVNSMAYGIPWSDNAAPAPVYQNTNQLLGSLFEDPEDAFLATQPYAGTTGFDIGTIDANGLPLYLDPGAPFLDLPIYDPELFY